MKRAVALPVVLVGVMAGVAPAPAGAQLPAFTLAVVRQDGILIPFATCEGPSRSMTGALKHAWTNYWPEPRPTFDVPISLEDVDERWWPDARPRVDWMLWLPDGEARPLKALAPVWFRAQCLANIGLRTDYRHPGPVPPPDTAPYPKVGLAIATWPGVDAAVEPIAIVDEDSQDWRWLRGSLTKAFNDAENRAIRGAGFKHPYATLERMAMPVALEALYRTPDTKPGTFIYYVEVVRRYPEKNPKKVQDPPCDLLTYAVGSVRRGPTANATPTVQATVTDCYRWNVGFMLPFGVVRQPSGQPLWVAQMSGWGREYYFVSDLLAPGASMSFWQTSGGWCR